MIFINKHRNKILFIIPVIILLLLIILININNKKEVILDNILVKENINKKTFAIYVEKDTYSSESDKYEEYEGTTWPSSGYSLNTDISICVDENGVVIPNALSINNNTVTLNTSKTTYCYIYFDKAIAWKYYGWNGSTTYDTFGEAQQEYVALRTSGSTALYSGINESNDIVQICVEIGFYQNDKMIFINPNSYNSNDLEEQCVDLIDGDVIYESHYSSNAELQNCYFSEYDSNAGVYGGIQSIKIYSNGNIEIDSYDNICKITGAGNASCYFD